MGEGGFLDLPNDTSSPCDSPEWWWQATVLTLPMVARIWSQRSRARAPHRPEDKAERPRREHEKTGLRFSDFSVLQNQPAGVLTHKASTAPPQRFWLSRSGKGLRILLSDDFSGAADRAGPGTTLGEPLSWAAPRACLWTSISTRRDSSWSNKSAKPWTGTSLVVQGLRIHLPMQGMWVPSLIRKLRSHTSQCN